MLTVVVWMSRSAMPSAASALSTCAIAALFWLMAWEAVAACVITPAFTSAVSGGLETAPEPTTVIEGAGSSAEIFGETMGVAARSTRVARAARMGRRMPSGYHQARTASARGHRCAQKNPPALWRRRRDYRGGKSY